MKRILFLHDSLHCGGVERALLDLINSLDKSKYSVTLILLNEGGEFFEKEKMNLPIKRVFSDFVVPNNKVCLKLRSIVINFLERNVYKHPKLYYRFAIGGKYDLEIAFSQFKSHQVIANSSNKQSKKIVWVHGNFATDEYMQFYYKRHPKLYDCFDAFDKVVLVSEAALRGFCDYMKLADILPVVKYNVINSQKIALLSLDDCNLEDIDERDNLICAVGRLALEKGFVRLIDIVGLLVAKGINLKLILVGDGPEKQNIEERIESKGLKNTVFMVGYDENPYKYMAQSKFLVCSSFTEGLPIVCQEALALGIPIVSSFPSVGELFGDEPCGIISDVDDDSLMAAIEKMLTDEEFYNSCKKAAERRSKCFDTRVAVREIEKMFDELLEE